MFFRQEGHHEGQFSVFKTSDVQHKVFGICFSDFSVCVDTSVSFWTKTFRQRIKNVLSLSDVSPTNHQNTFNYSDCWKKCGILLGLFISNLELWMKAVYESMSRSFLQSHLTEACREIRWSCLLQILQDFQQSFLHLEQHLALQYDQLQPDPYQTWTSFSASRYNTPNCRTNRSSCRNYRSLIKRYYQPPCAWRFRWELGIVLRPHSCLDPSLEDSYPFQSTSGGGQLALERKHLDEI